MKRILWLLMSAMLLVAASCGSSATDTEGATSASDSETDSSVDTPTTEPTEVVPAGEASDRVLRVMWGTPGGSNYDPHTAFNPFANVFLYPAYDRLIELNPEGELLPMLAESWEFLEGDTVLRLNLRTDVTFHDGEAFNAEAVKANIERGKTLETSAVKQDLAPIEEVLVVDEFTVDLMLAEPGAAVPALLSDRAGMMISPAAFDNEDLDLFPVGAGAFKVTDHQPGAVISFERFEGYWAPEMQAVGGLDIQMQLDPEARLRAMQDGQIDLTTIGPDLIDPAESAGLEVQTRPVAAAFLLYLNKTKPGLDDPKVREAISLAIDREGIASALHNGRCTPSVQIFPPTYWAGDKDLASDPFDVEAARALMEEAGYGDGLALSAVVVNVSFYVSQLEALQAQLGEIGIDLEVVALEPTELLSRFASGEADMYYSQWPGAVDPAKTVASLMGAESSLNPGGYLNAQIEDLAAQGVAILDQDTRAPIYQEISRVVAEDHFHIVVCNPEAIYVQAPEVGGVTPTLGGSFDFRGATLSE